MQTAHHTPYTPGMRESLRKALAGAEPPQLEMLREYYQKRRHDLPEGLELVEAEINARNDHKQAI